MAPGIRQYAGQLTAVLAEGRRGDGVALAMTDLMPAEAVSEMRETPVGAAFESVQHGTEDLRRHVVGLAFQGAVLRTGRDGVIVGKRGRLAEFFGGGV